MSCTLTLPDFGERASSYIDLILSRGSLPNALILNGPDPLLLRKYATYLAAANACEKNGDICGSCESCRRVLNKITPDVIDVFPDDGKQSINVERARELRADAYIAPNELEFKVYILHEADKMNVQTQNALLKILEEPPRFVSFILLSSNVAAFLPTVRSRCQLVSISAESESNSKQSKFRQLAIDTITILSGKRRSLLIDILTALPSERVEYKEYISEMMSAFRDIIAYKSGAVNFVFFESIDSCREYATVFSENASIEAYDTLYSALNDNSANIYMLLSQTRLISGLWRSIHS
jgi:hypothetical protein